MSKIKTEHKEPDPNFYTDSPEECGLHQILDETESVAKENVFKKTLGWILSRRSFKHFEKVVLNIFVWSIIKVIVSTYILLAGIGIKIVPKSGGDTFRSFADDIAFYLVVAVTIAVIALLGWFGRKYGYNKYAKEYKDLLREDLSGFLVNFSSVLLIYYYLIRFNPGMLLIPFVLYLISYFILPGQERN